MTTIKSWILGNGQVQYYSRIEAVSDTTEIKGKITINNIGSAGVPGHYKVNFMIASDISDGSILDHGNFFLTAIVPTEDAGVPYRQVENEAVLQLAPMLRSVADQIERQVAEIEAKRSQSIS